MSTTREVRTAHDLGMECAAVSCITNRAAGLAEGPITHEEVLTTATARSELLANLLEKLLQLL
jgi:purine-nucleoside phosphorylase